MGVIEIFVISVCVCLIWSLIKFLHKVWWTPSCIKKMMSSQGIKGPPYKFPQGTYKDISIMRSQSLSKPMEIISHDIFQRIQPHVYAWKKIYGMNILYWHGSKGELFVTDSELIKEILTNKEGAYPKMEMDGFAKKLLGAALITNEGEKWAKVRKLANHTFHAESLKNMIPMVTESVEKMLERWKIFQGKEINVAEEFGVLTTDAISRTAFGNSYLDGKHIFEMMAKLLIVTAKNVYNVRFPGMSLILKNSDEIEAENLEHRIKSSILELVKSREEKAKNEGTDDYGDDYLGQLVKISHESDIRKRVTLEQIIDEIKTIYGAGHLTSKTLLSWTVLLLATDTQWQEKARKEVLELFGTNNPTSDGIARLRTMSMIINESLRLYPPAINMVRKVSRRVKLGNITLPANINIFISILALHHDPNLWGKDVHQFKPERFMGGVAKATNNNNAAFFPFGLGPRTCVGLNFTINEAKIALSMILQRYKFTLSPNYVHYPTDVFLLTPKNGVQVILQPI